MTTRTFSVAEIRQSFLDYFASRGHRMVASAPLVLTCRHGLRSAALARLLRAEGLDTLPKYLAERINTLGSATNPMTPTIPEPEGAAT